MIPGIDYLGGANYGRVILNNHPKGWAAGFMLNTNRPNWKKTDCWPIIDRLCERGVPLIRVQAVWEDDHAYKPKIHDPIMDREFARAVQMQRKYPNTRIQFSWLCENNMTAAQNSAMVRRYGSGGIELVNSIWKGAQVPGCVTEVHGTHSVPRGGKHNYSYDGTHCFDTDVVKMRDKHKDADVFFFWCVQCNGRYNNKPKGTPGWDSTPRDKRTSWLYKKLLLSIIPLWQDEPRNVSLRGNQIWKTHADQHKTLDDRANKPVLISPHNGAVAELVTLDGKIIARGANSGVFNDGSRRRLYRFTKFGYELAQFAGVGSGNPMVNIRIGGKVVGFIHPAFRAGVFRD